MVESKERNENVPPQAKPRIDGDGTFLWFLTTWGAVSLTAAAAVAFLGKGGLELRLLWALQGLAVTTALVMIYAQRKIERARSSEGEMIRSLQRQLLDRADQGMDSFLRSMQRQEVLLTHQVESNQRLAHDFRRVSEQLAELKERSTAEYASANIKHIRAPESSIPTPIDTQSFLQELADLNTLAIRGSLEHTQTIIRGQPKNPCQYRVWFGTDRRMNKDGDFSAGFSEEYSDVLRCGSCVVHIPQSHEFGSIGSTFVKRILNTVVSKNADEKLKLLAIETGTPESMVQDLRALLSELPPHQRDLALFIHGYNVDFESAAIRAAQVGRDIGLPGPMTFFSWPSRAKLRGYGADEATIDRSLPKFRQFLQLLLTIPEATAVNVIAHSMGNRLLQRAIDRFAAQESRYKRFGHVVMAAPDIDRETFRQAAADYARLKASPDKRTALYFNHSDFAITASGWIHKESRAGAAGGGLPNIDSILWSDSWFRLDWLGHGYFATAAPVLRDIKALLIENKAPQERNPPLTPIPDDVPQYWELKA